MDCVWLPSSQPAILSRWFKNIGPSEPPLGEPLCKCPCYILFSSSFSCLNHKRIASSFYSHLLLPPPFHLTSLGTFKSKKGCSTRGDLSILEFSSELEFSFCLCAGPDILCRKLMCVVLFWMHSGICFLLNVWWDLLPFVCKYEKISLFLESFEAGPADLCFHSINMKSCKQISP